MKINTALILCAGFGKRLSPLTLETPKPLLKINNITILENCINFSIKSGVKKILLNTFHLNEQIYNFVKSKNILNLSAFIFVLATILPIIPSGSFFTSYTATLFWINFSFLLKKKF